MSVFDDLLGICCSSAETAFGLGKLGFHEAHCDLILCIITGLVPCVGSTCGIQCGAKERRKCFTLRFTQKVLICRYPPSHTWLYSTHVVVFHTRGCMPHTWLYAKRVVVYHTCGCMPHMWLYATHVVVCHKCGCMPHTWLYATRVVVCQTRGCMPHVWLYATHVVVCHTRGCIPHMWLYATHVVVCHTCGCMPHTWLYATHVVVCHTCGCMRFRNCLSPNAKYCKSVVSYLDLKFHIYIAR